MKMIRYVVLFVVFVCAASQDSKSWPQGKIVRVTTILNDPWIVQSKPPTKGNDNFKGFIPDLLKEAFGLLMINYNITVVKDGKYGARGSNGKWNGMIGELNRKEADVAAADLSMTSSRLRAVDFSVPFHASTTKVLLTRPAEGKTLPRSLSELTKVPNFRFVIIRGGQTARFLSISRNPLVKKIYRQIVKTRHFVQTPQEAFVKLKEKNYGFITDGASIEKLMASSCQFATIGGFGPNVYYGLALRPGLPFRDNLSIALLLLSENGKLEALHRKWFVEKRSCPV